MGREQLAVLARIIEEQLTYGTESPIVGTWTIRFDGGSSLFYFDKCEFGEYCEERPAIISLAGEVIDRGGPIVVGE
jgi:hypothetical protein